MVIVQHIPVSVKQPLALEYRFAVPDRCPQPQCGAEHTLIRWGTYKRWFHDGARAQRIRIQRLYCKQCGRTHSLLPDFVLPHRLYHTDLVQRVISRYLLAGWGWRRLQGFWPQLPRSTLREWVAAFAYGAGVLLLDPLRRALLRLAPRASLPMVAPPAHLRRLADRSKHRQLERSYHFWLWAEQLYAQVKARQVRLHFGAAQLFRFLLHWLQQQRLPPRLLWSPRLSTTLDCPR